MKLSRPLWIIALTLLGGCASHGAKTATVSTPAAKSYPVITRLVGRHQTVTISAGPGAALYSVQSPDGATLVSYVTLNELRERHPNEFKMVEPLVAADESEAYAGIATVE